MRSYIAVLTIAALALGPIGLAHGAEATVGADLASAYVFRGVTLNDGLVVQPYIEVSGLPVDLGVWANYDVDDYDGNANDGQFSEIDLYASYALPLPIEVASFSVGYTEYTYPGSGGDAEVTTAPDGTATAESTFGESDREVSLGAEVNAPLSPAVTVYYGLDGGIDGDVYVEAGLGHELEVAEGLALELGATLGYLSPDAEDADDGFSHWTASASLGYKILSAGVTYIGQIDDDVLPDGEGAYDVEVVGTLGLSHEF
jgi:uncharacterized protein (TIGR02001 family)